MVHHNEFSSNISMKNVFNRIHRIFLKSKENTKFYAIIVFMVLLLGRDFTVKYSKSEKNRNSLQYSLQFQLKYFQLQNTIYFPVSYRRLGKKLTPNFLTRYLYGNKQRKGILNFHLNIRSLKNKVNEVENIVKNEMPHIFGVSEAELDKSNATENDLKIPGYKILFPKSWHSHGYARVVVYIKNNLNYEQVEALEDSSFQSIWLKYNQKNGSPIYFCHAYREHLQEFTMSYQKSKLEMFLKQWENALELNHPHEVNEVHVCLDMNLDSYKEKWLQSDYNLLSLSRLVQNYCDIGNFTQLVTDPTRFMYNSVNNTTELSCLDHVYTNSKFKCTKPTIVPFGNSDHDLVSYTRYSKQSPTNNPTIMGRSYKYFSEDNFINDLKRMTWDDVYGSLDLNLAVQNFTEKLNFIFNIHAPWIKYQRRNNYVPWMSSELKSMILQRDYWNKTSQIIFTKFK